MLDKHFVRATDKDEIYSFGPKVSPKEFNPSQTVTLTISEFLTPTLFFACESTNNCLLDRQINLLYNSLGASLLFSQLPKIGTVCVGRYSVDNRWYRARVVDRHEKEKTADLLFIDYGNTERSVKMDNLRKLEGTLSTQFSSFMKCSKLNSQAALFGFIGVLTDDGDDKGYYMETVKKLEMKRCFDFQIMNIPLMKSNIKNDQITNIPFYLIKNNIFNKDSSTNYSDILINELKWRKSDVDESISFLIKSFKNRHQYLKNVYFLLPSLLQEYNDDFNKKAESIHSLEDDDDENCIECITPPYSVDGDSEDEEDKQSISSVKGDRKRSENDVLLIESKEENNKEKEMEVSDDQKKEIEISNGQIDGNKEEEIVNEDEFKFCSIVNWKMTSILVKSLIEGLKWHLPIPEETTFKAIVTTFNDRLEFHINICSEDITETFRNLEKELLKHFVLCNDSMLKQYVTSNSSFSKGTLCLGSYRSTYIRCSIVDTSSDNNNGDVTCKLIDFGDEIILNKSDLIPISDQFCQVPPLALKCVLTGFDGIELLREKFHSVIEEADYQVLVSLCLSNRIAYFQRMDEKIIVEQPIPVELFIVKESGDVVSVNGMLKEMLPRKEIIEEEEEEEIDDNENEEEFRGMKDIFINENLHQQSNMNSQNDKRPVCEYYRAKGRCFKGSKCQDRHVNDSDESDNDSEDWKMMENMHYLDDDFERDLIVGSIIGMRISAIYTTGVFYGYLTHDINGFIDDGLTYYDDDSDDDDEGMEFKSIQDMEANLKDFLKFQQVNVDKRFDLPVNTLVVVSEDDIVHRGSIRKMVSDNRYQVFLVDYGVPVEASVTNLSLLPKKYLSKFKQQCFMCKLHAVPVTEDKSEKFANWFFEQVNRKILHCKVVDTDQDGINYVELYNFNEAADSSINQDAIKFLQ